ncbi:MAG: nitroreductase family protein [Candidatus Diapherotrites archaeon]
MEFFEVVDKRFSARSYLSKNVDEKLLEKILKTLSKAPSAGNLKAYRVYVIKDQETKDKLTEAAFFQQFISEAPLVLVFCALPKISSKRYGKRGAELYCIQDATIAASYAQLAATALGLATCWVGAFDDDRVKKILNLQEEIPIAIMPLGYTNEKKIK